MVALDDSGEALAFRGARDLDDIAGLEYVIHCNCLADLHVRRVFYADLLQLAPRLDVGVFRIRETALEVSQFSFCEMFGPDFAESDLDSGISVCLNTLELRDNAGACFYHGDRRNGPILIEEMSHPDLLAQNCVNHCFLRVEG